VQHPGPNATGQTHEPLLGDHLPHRPQHGAAALRSDPGHEARLDDVQRSGECGGYSPCKSTAEHALPWREALLVGTLEGECLEVLEGGVAEHPGGEVAEERGGVSRVQAEEAVGLDDVEEHLPGAACGGAGLEALRDELLGDHDGGGGDVAAGAGKRGHEEGRQVGAEQRLGELAGAEVDGGGGGGAEDDGGETAVEAEGPVGAEDIEEDLPGGGGGRGGGLEAGLDGVDGKQSGVGEGPRGGARAGPDGGAREWGGGGGEEGRRRWRE